MQALLTIMIVDVEPLIAAAFVRSRSQMCERWDLLAAVRTPTTTPAYSMEGWICAKFHGWDTVKLAAVAPLLNLTSNGTRKSGGVQQNDEAPWSWEPRSQSHRV